MAADTLFAPTLADRTPHVGPKPWRLASLYGVGIFGSAGASALVAYLNARRLGMGARPRRRMLAIGSVALLLNGAWLAVALGMASPSDGAGAASTVRDGLGVLRILVPVVNLGLTWPLVKMQTRADRLYQLEIGSEAEYESVLRVGGLAVLVSMLAIAVIAISILLAFDVKSWTTH